MTNRNERAVRTLLCVCAIFTALSVVPTGARVRVDWVDDAIACGLGKMKCQDADEPISGGTLRLVGFEIVARGAAGRVWVAAAEAKKKYLPFDRSAVTEEMTSPTLEIRARNVDTDMTRITNVTHIVILPKGAKDGAIQPTSIVDWDNEAKNLMGARFPRTGKIAQFAVADLPPGDIDVIAVDDRYKREARSTLKAADRDRILKWSPTKK